jgi:hypothetical protein
MVNVSVHIYQDTVKALNAAADAKGLTRNALIVQLLAKATKTTKSREDER